MQKTALIAIFLSFFCLVNLAWGEMDVQETTRLAKSGDAEAQYFLGLKYDQGQGVPQNYVEAVKWFRKAAEQGLAEAQFALGLKYDKGEGTPKNFINSYVWLSVASAKGNEKAKKYIEIISSEMTPQQVAQAQNEAAELWKRINKSKK
jgi:TPR repeat protein